MPKLSMHRSMHRRVHRRMRRGMDCAHGGSCKRGSTLTQHSIQLRYFLCQAMPAKKNSTLSRAEHAP